MSDPGSPTLTFTTPLSPNDPIFSLTSLPTHKSLTNSIRRQTRTIRNRLHSIHVDSLFVTSVARSYSLPILTNSRAGDWYVDPRNTEGSVYFKSTDGHTGEWGFSLRRLNYNLLDLAGRDGGRGVIVVDSTRRGKRFPDALLKTVPIWLAVMNAVVFPERGVEVHTHPSVPETEKEQILRRVQGWKDAFLGLGPDLERLRKSTTRPLRPLYVSPDSTLPEEPPWYEEFIPVVCCTASRMVTGEGVEGEYIQGAGDDHEGWSKGLIPQKFWRNVDVLLAARDDEEVEQLLESIVAEKEEAEGDAGGLSRITGTKVYLGSSTVVGEADAPGNVIIDCTPDQSTPVKHAKMLALPTQNTKPELKKLRVTLPVLLEQLEGLMESAERVVVVDATGGDEIAPMVALAVLCRYYGEDRDLGGNLRGGKEGVKKRLSWVVTDRGSVKPMRVGLNAVNEVVLR